jgi:hypothetical protein
MQSRKKVSVSPAVDVEDRIQSDDSIYRELTFSQALHVPDLEPSGWDIASGKLDLLRRDVDAGYLKAPFDQDPATGNPDPQPMSSTLDPGARRSANRSR